MRRPFALLTVAALLTLAPPALASLTAANAAYDSAWHTLAAGGRSGGGGYTLVGAAGQADAGSPSGGGFTLFGGFLAGAMDHRALYLPIVLKGR